MFLTTHRRRLYENRADGSLLLAVPGGRYLVSGSEPEKDFSFLPLRHPYRRAGGVARGWARRG